MLRVPFRVLSPGLLAATLLAGVCACGSSGPKVNAPSASPAAANAPPTTSTPNTLPSTPQVTMTANTPFDPVSVGQTPDGARRLCDDHLGRARAILDESRALEGTPTSGLTYEKTIGRFDDAITEVSDAEQFPFLMAVAHPDKAVRDAAKECEPKVEQLTTPLYMDAHIAAVLKAFAGTDAGKALTGEKARLLHDTLRDFRRNGLELAPEKQAQLSALNKEITELGQNFTQNIAGSTGKVKFTPKQLDGLPPDYIAKHPVVDGKVEISTDYPDFFPFVTYAKDRKAALELYVLFTNRGGDANVKILERLLDLRSQKAKLLGYATWADYTTETRMAKSAKEVNAFLAQVRAAVKEPAQHEFKEFAQEHAALGGKATDPIPPSDRYFLEDRLRNKKYSFDAKELANYFEVGTVTQGLLDVTAAMYGIEYREVPAAAWHPDVRAFEVYADGKMLGKFYLDLYPRADKFKHAAMFPIRSAKRLPDGTYQLPMAVLECNFPHPAAKPGDPPGLMEHTDVVTFFHEFGHVLHHVLTRSELATFSGTNTARDFVEAPSQMFEEWAWDRSVLDRFARHHATGAKIPDSLFASMQKARSFGRALATQRQLFLASLDFEYHSRAPGFDTTKLVTEIQKANDPFAYVPGTHFQSSFGHLVGYDAGYYGYQWALSLSRDVLTRFKKEGLMNPTTARAWRDEVLAKGGGEDEKAMVTHFLGREPNENAYVQFLKGAD
ncbi:MAG TPA: M3 family metallopeptidase [Polyangiaceae bacterium]